MAGSGRRHLGELLQLAGGGSTLAGVYVLFGLGVFLVVAGLSVLAVGTLHEAGRL